MLFLKILFLFCELFCLIGENLLCFVSYRLFVAFPLQERDWSFIYYTWHYSFFSYIFYIPLEL